MKKILLLLLLANTAAHAQQPDSVHAYLDANNIRPRINAMGDMWWDLINAADCSYPANSGKNIAFAGALWMGGYDNGGTLHMAAQTYRQTDDPLDYWSGPAFFPIDSAASSQWAKIWKVNQADIDAFLLAVPHTLGNTPQAVLTWPGKDNPYATGWNGAALTISKSMAPFVDVDGDGMYNPLLGDYPAIKGKEMLWSVFTDQKATHGQTHAPPLGIEVHQSVYGYQRGTPIDNVVFYEFLISNESSNTYTDFYAGFFTDLDLGGAFDDYAGFDSSRRMGMQYNGGSYDFIYASEIPSTGILLLHAPGDAPNQPVETDFFYFTNTNNLVNGNPATDMDFYNYLQCKGRDRLQKHYADTFWVNLEPPFSHGYECDSMTASGDRRFLLTTPGLTFAPGATLRYVYAQVVAPNTGGCPTLDFSGLAEVADTAIAAFVADSATGVTNLTAHLPPLQLYPNPATQEVTTALEGTPQKVEVINTIGERIPLHWQQRGKTLSVTVAALPAGVYTLAVQQGGAWRSGRFVKR